MTFALGFIAGLIVNFFFVMWLVGNRLTHLASKGYIKPGYKFTWNPQRKK